MEVVRGRRSGRNEFMIPVATLSPLTRMIPALRWAAVRDILMGDEVTRQCPQTTEKPFGRERYPELTEAVVSPSVPLD